MAHLPKTGSSYYFPHSRRFVLFGMLVVLIGGGVSVAHAAPLNFATAEGVSLAVPTTTLTITVGSAADDLTITTSSVKP